MGVSPRRAGFWGGARGDVSGGVVRPTGDVSVSCAPIATSGSSALVETRTHMHAHMHAYAQQCRACRQACNPSAARKGKHTLAEALPLEAACGEKGLRRPADAWYSGDSVCTSSIVTVITKW